MCSPEMRCKMSGRNKNDSGKRSGASLVGLIARRFLFVFLLLILLLASALVQIGRAHV